MIRGVRPVLRLPQTASRGLNRPAAPSASFSTRISPASSTSASASACSKRPSAALVAYTNRVAVISARASYSKSPYDKIDVKAEKEVAKQKLEARPEEVSTESTTRQFVERTPAPPGKKEDVQDGLAHDLGIVKDTFAMTDVPREPYLLGLAGTLPYLGTSLATVYLSWDLSTQWPTSSTITDHIFMNHESAKYLLSMLEPIQLGYGAIIISFLGAVHWGMEYTAKTPSASRTKFRYSIGVLAPVVAWPTLLMPIEAALITQFAAFTFLYGVDTRASTRGWAPAWYGRYRFILTAVVGVAIFISLVGRTKIGSSAPRLGESLADSMHADRAEPYTEEWAKLEEKEKRKIKKEKEAEERRKKQEEQKKKQEEIKQAQQQQQGKKDDGEGEGEEKQEEADADAKDTDKDGKKGGEGGDEKSKEKKG